MRRLRFRPHPEVEISKAFIASNRPGYALATVLVFALRAIVLSAGPIGIAYFYLR